MTWALTTLIQLLLMAVHINCVHREEARKKLLEWIKKQQASKLIIYTI
jgi:hypothetical protein